MTTTQIADLFLKGNECAKLSPKQYNWLIDVAKQEGIANYGGHGWWIYLPDNRIIKLKEGYYPISAYGGFVGKRPTGTFTASVVYLIKYTDTGNKEIISKADFSYLKTKGFAYEFINGKELHTQIAY